MADFEKTLEQRAREMSNNPQVLEILKNFGISADHLFNNPEKAKRLATGNYIDAAIIIDPYEFINNANLYLRGGKENVKAVKQDDGKYKNFLRCPCSLRLYQNRDNSYNVEVQFPIALSEDASIYVGGSKLEGSVFDSYIKYGHGGQTVEVFNKAHLVSRNPSTNQPCTYLVKNFTDAMERCKNTMGGVKFTKEQVETLASGGVVSVKDYKTRDMDKPYNGKMVFDAFYHTLVPLRELTPSERFSHQRVLEDYLKQGELQIISRSKGVK